jgi:hypothetical protein
MPEAMTYKSQIAEGYNADQLQALWFDHGETADLVFLHEPRCLFDTLVRIKHTRGD